MGIANSYPVFQADQVLTNNHLNDLHRYLDQQNRLTRSKLIGCGIVCGLEITSGSASIKISKGCALTSQGYLVTLCDSEYKFHIPYSAPGFPKHLDFIRQCGDTSDKPVPFYDPDFNQGLLQLITTGQHEKLDEDTQSSAVDLSTLTSSSMDDFAAVLFLEAEELDLKNCDTNDCNDKGSRMDFEVKVLLVKKAILDKINAGSGQSGSSTTLPPVSLKRYNVPVKNIKSADDVLLGFTDLVDNLTIDRLGQLLNASYTEHSWLLENGTENPFVDVITVLKQRRDQVVNTIPVLVQYFYDHLDDILKALYEFKFKAWDLSSECCIDEMRFPLHIMLGEANVNTAVGTRSAYRQYFIYSPLFDHGSERLREIRLLFTRLKLLVLQFSFEGLIEFEKLTVKITPSRYGKAFLSERCIPYYYKVAEAQKELFASWSFAKTNRGHARFNLGYNATQYSNGEPMVDTPLFFDTERFNFYRVEGHIGKSINNAMVTVKKLKQDFNLPFDTIALSADYIGTILRGEEPKCVIQDLESDYRILIAGFVCQLHDAFCSVAAVRFRPPVRAVLATNLIATAVFARSFNAAAAASTIDLGKNAVTEEDEEDEILKTGLEGKLAIVAHPFVSTLVSEFHTSKAYRKGDTLQRLCKPAKGSVGAAYLSAISQNIGQFRNPVAASRAVFGTSLYNQLFELLDRIETMFEILMNNELADFNITVFKGAYDRYELTVKGLYNALSKITDSVQSFLDTCIIEKLEALKNEYLRRTAEYRLAKNFSYYFSKHGGLEHKAGVPRGGTFILVYHEQRRNRFIDVRSLVVNNELSTLLVAHFKDLLQPVEKLDDVEFKTKELQTATLFKDPDLHIRFKDVMHQFLDECESLPPERKDRIKAIINRPPRDTKFNLTDGMVIADFYVPYLCCSDCPPIVYILPKQVDTVQPTISIKNKEFCDNVPGESSIIVTPGGGTITGIAAQPIDVNTFIFNTANMQAGSFTITYTVNGQPVSDTIIIHPAPSAGFRPVPVAGKPHVIQFTSEDTNDQTKHTWDFGDPESGNNNFSDQANPMHEYHFSGASKLFGIVHTATSQKGCNDTDKQELTVRNSDEEIIERKVFCFREKIPLENDVTNGNVLNLEELRRFFHKNQLSIAEDLVLTIGREPDETLNFTIRYKFNIGNADVTKKVEVIIIGVNTRFNLRHDVRTKSLVFRTLAANPGIIKWDIVFHNGTVADGKKFNGDTREMKIFIGDINDFELFDVRLSISQNESGSTCKRTKEIQLKVQEALNIQGPGGQNF